MQIEVNRFRPYHLRFVAKTNQDSFELRKKGTLGFTKRETRSLKTISKMPETVSPGRLFPADQAWVILIGRWLPGGLALPSQESLDVPDQVLGVENGTGGHALVVLALQLGDV